MNVTASQIVVESFLKGCIDVFEALFTVSFGAPGGTLSPKGMKPLDRAALEEALAAMPFSMAASLKRKGAFGLLFTVGDAARFAALAMGETPAPKDALTGDDLGTLKEVASSCIGGGVSNLMAAFGQGPDQLTDVLVGTGPAAVETLLKLLGGSGVMAAFTFSSAPDFDGRGVLMFSGDVEAMVPAALVSKAQAPGVDKLAANARLSEAEMSDILSGFSPEADDAVSGTAGGSLAHGHAGLPAPHNIEMVLDIRVTAAARLGRIEMPIGEILELGPGSIIEVGHLVDEPIELIVNEKLIARGDVVVIDEKFGLRITEIVSPQQRIESLR